MLYIMYSGDPEGSLFVFHPWKGEYPWQALFLFFTIDLYAFSTSTFTSFLPLNSSALVRASIWLHCSLLMFLEADQYLYSRILCFPIKRGWGIDEQAFHVHPKSMPGKDPVAPVSTFTYFWTQFFLLSLANVTVWVPSMSAIYLPCSLDFILKYFARGN